MSFTATIVEPEPRSLTVVIGLALDAYQDYCEDVSAAYDDFVFYADGHWAASRLSGSWRCEAAGSTGATKNRALAA